MTELRRKPEIDYYKVLQVDSEAELEVIEAAYRALSKKYHPDINRAADSMDRMSRINSAYDVLSDPSKRRDYNSLRNSANSRVTSTVASNPNPPTSTGAYWSPGATQKTAGPTPTANPNPPPGARPSPNQAGAKAGPPPPKSPPPSNGNTTSFRPQTVYPTGSASDPARANRSEPVYDAPRSRAWLWLLLLFLLIVLGVGGVLAQEVWLGNPLKTSFISITSSNRVAVTTVGPGVVATAQASTPQPAVPTSREQISAFLNSADLYAGRVGDVGLTGPDVLQLKVKLAANGGVLNSESPPIGRTADDLDNLRQSEVTTYNLIYSLFGRFQDLSRINLVLTDPKDKLIYRADVTRPMAYTFYPWHANLNNNDPSEVSKAARQDRLALHFGAPLDDNLRTHLNAPTEANMQAELQSIGLTAFTVTGGAVPTISYFQARSQAETAVDFARIVYTLYTRFPTLDRLQITVSTSPDKPVKLIDRQLFTQIGLETWSQASYGGANAGGDRMAQSLIAALPGNPGDLRTLSVTVQSKFKTPVQVGTWYVVTENVERYDTLTLEGLKFATAKDRQFVVVRVALRNTADGRQWLMPGERMTLFDTRGQTYTADPAATLLYILKTPPSTESPPTAIDPNKQGAVYVVFSVPTNTSLATLRLQFQDGDKKAALELS